MHKSEVEFFLPGGGLFLCSPWQLHELTICLHTWSVRVIFATKVLRLTLWTLGDGGCICFLLVLRLEKNKRSTGIGWKTRWPRSLELRFRCLDGWGLFLWRLFFRSHGFWSALSAMRPFADGFCLYCGWAEGKGAVCLPRVSQER